ncbi:MAG: hypothetical protein IKR94_08005 [Bacteroidales bacterium]|nr:hypothetical protein [Bacteroidales bacterium]
MKKWIIIIGSIILALIIIGVLHDAGYLNFKWTTLTKLFAALACPFMLMKNMFFNKNDSVTNIQQAIQEAKEGIFNDNKHREEYDAQISAKKEEIQTLEKQIENLDNKIRILETQKENVNVEVRNLSSDEMMAEFEKYYGNEKDD